MTTTETLDLAPYSEVKAAIAKMKAESAGLTFDYETPKGNKLARSHVAALRTYKGDIERERKEAEARRAADAKHRHNVLNEIVVGLMRHGEIDEAHAKLIVEALATGKVRHVTVNF